VYQQQLTVGRGPPWLGKLIGHAAREALLGRYSWTHVERVALSGMRAEFDTEVAAELSRLCGLRQLEIHNSRSSEELFAAIGQLGSLQRLFIRHASIDEEGFAHLGRLTELEELFLVMDCNLTDRGAEHLSRLVNLRKLVVPDSTISRRGVEALVAHRELETIHLGASNLDDKGLLRLASLPKLRNLTFRSTKVTLGAISQFRRLRPDVDLVAWPVSTKRGGR
jgi:hypothetical protein